VRNVVPVIDYGETGDAWVLVMPRAGRSLREELTGLGGRLPLDRAVAVRRDVATALADMAGRVVHRDLKPENILLLDGAWCLADFGLFAEGDADYVTDDVPSILGWPARRFEQFATDYAAVFS
jgi:serine/threonine protein kinase